jgi:paraquat-inducible protein B
MAGRVVGRVRAVELEVDAASGNVRTPMRIALDPAAFGLDPGDAEGTRGMLSKLVENGLRARVQATRLILGGKEVALVMVDNAPPAKLDLAADLPELPTASAQSIDTAIAAVNRFIEKLRALPMDQIASNVQSFTEQVDKLAASPEVEGAIANIQASMERIKAIAASAQGNVEPILKSVKRTAESAESAADAIARLSGASPREQQDLEELVAELIRMVESVRTLTDYLTRHPEAILQGRPGK